MAVDESLSNASEQYRHERAVDLQYRDDGPIKRACFYDNARHDAKFLAAFSGAVFRLLKAARGVRASLVKSRQGNPGTWKPAVSSVVYRTFSFDLRCNGRL